MSNDKFKPFSYVSMPAGMVALRPSDFTPISTVNKPSSIFSTFGNTLSKLDDKLSKSEIYNSLKEAYTAPMRAYRGEIDPTNFPEQAALEALNMAGTVGVSGMTVPRPAGSLGMFGGLKSKTANKVSQAKAAEMLQDGVPPAEVWLKTGWGIGTDGKWRYEIPDDLATFISANLPQGKDRLEIANDYLHSNGVRPTLDISSPSVPQALRQEALQYADMVVEKGAPPAPLSTVLQHGKVFRAYPEEGSIALSREISGKIGLGGSYDPVERTMTVGGLVINSNPEKQLTSTTLHELQHAIQRKEGFARGGSTESFAGAKDMVEALSTEKANLPGAAEYWRRIESGMSKADARKGLSSAEMVEALGYKNSSQLTLRMKHIDDELSKWADAAIDPYGAYKRLAGEAEARLVQSRMSMTPEQRAALYPWEPDYFKAATGVDINNLIYIYDDALARAVR